MKLSTVYRKLFNESVSYKNSYEGEFLKFDYYDNSTHIGQGFVRLKRGWNQFHLEIFDAFQKKGYGAECIKVASKKMHYITIQDGRIVNSNVFKLISKVEMDPNFEVFRHDKYNETVISDKSMTVSEILEKIK